jgi:hypothetical protein
MAQWVSNRYKTLTARKDEPEDNHRGEHDQQMRCSYLEWARWLQAARKSPKWQMQLQRKVAFWKEYLQGVQRMPVINTRNIKESTKLQQHFGTTQPVAIPNIQDSSAAIAYSQRLAVAATAITLRAVAGMSDIVLALPYVNRDDRATANMLGLFVDRIPVRLLLSEDKLASASDLLDLVGSAAQSAVESHMPYRQIQVAVGAFNNHVAASGHFVEVLVIHNWQTDALERSVALGPDLRISTTDYDIPARAMGAMFPLLFNYDERENGDLVVEIEYNPDIIPAETVKASRAFLPRAVQGLARRESPLSLITS